MLTTPWQSQPLTSPYDQGRMRQIIKDRHTLGAGHSPALRGLLTALDCPEPRAVKDLCFLTNPYAGDLVFEYMHRDFVAQPHNLRDLTEAYPSQNGFIAADLARHLDLPADNILIGNGTIELIQFFIHALGLKKILVPLPSFSTYYEVDTACTEVVPLPLDPEQGFRLTADDLVAAARQHQVDSVVWINPHNPTGTFIPKDELRAAFGQLTDMKAIFCDESFLHFVAEGADEGDGLLATSLAPSFRSPDTTLANLIVMKSLAKDYGAAGLRVGYGIMAKERKDWAMSKGFLWNSNGLAEWFYRLLGGAEFHERYLEARRRYLTGIASFSAKLTQVEGLEAYATKANFILARTTNGMSGYDLMERLLLEHSVYIRDCGTKIGLDHRYVRIAVGRQEDEDAVIAALQAALRG